MEVGVGLGGSAWHFATGREYRGYEPDRAAFEIAARRLKDQQTAELHNELLPQPDRTFEAVVALEVLEHIEDDLGALRLWKEWLDQDGLLIISVPAKKKRFGPYDRQVGHYRRYEREDLKALLHRAGFDRVEIRSYGMPLGYLLEFVRNRFLAARLEVQPMSLRTARSGRVFQTEHFPGAMRAAIWPFQVIQRAFEHSDVGIGYIVTARTRK